MSKSKKGPSEIDRFTKRIIERSNSPVKEERRGANPIRTKRRKGIERKDYTRILFWINGKNHGVGDY